MPGAITSTIAMFLLAAVAVFALIIGVAAIALLKAEDDRDSQEAPR